jgi:cytoskeleton protein RodZ
MKGLTLEDLSRDTRIAARLLLALEEDRFADLPAPIFVRGFIRAYCAVVAEPPERALALYDSVSGAPHGPSAVPRIAAVVQTPARRSRLSLRRLAPKLGLAGVLVVIGGAAYFFSTSAASRPSDASRPRGEVTPAAARPARAPSEAVAVWTPAASADPAALALAPKPVPTPVSVPAPAPLASAPIAMAPVEKPTAAPAPLAAPPAPKPAPAPAPAMAPATRPVERRAHVLVARAHESTWVSVQSGDEVASHEVLEPGSVREWQSAGRFTVTVGNAGGLTLELDGVALPPLGGHGQVVRDVRLPRDPTP